jgi:prepilin-type N-terminal cleavage/methylation domain-containing protein
MNTLLQARRKQRGFSLIELIVAIAILLVITAVAFEALNQSQQRFKMESEFMATFQDARQAVDLMTRDIHSAGFPPANQFSAAVLAVNPASPAIPFAWSTGGGYPNIGCSVGGTCAAAAGGPGPFDLILEADLDPAAGDGVEWVRYRLNGTVLERGEAQKVAGGDPETTTARVMVPYVDNVINNTTPAQMAAIRAFYPAMFPGNAPVPMFQYLIDAGAPATPPNIREVNITIIVLSPNPDPRSRQLRAVTLTARARRFNPSQ